MVSSVGARLENLSRRRLMTTFSDLSDRHLTDADAAQNRVAERHVSPGNDACRTATEAKPRSIVDHPQTTRDFRQMDTYEDPAAAQRRLQRELRR